MNAKTRRAKKTYEDINRRLRALSLTFFLNSWEEEHMPPAARTYRSCQLVELSSMAYELQTGRRYMVSIENLYADRENLDPVLRHEVEEAKLNSDKLARIPKEEYLAYQNVILECYPENFVKAKTTGDFSIVKPYLKSILEYNLKYVRWEETDELKGYDVLLDEYEKGMTVKKYDEFFDLIKTELVPFIKKVLSAQRPVHPAFSTRTFPVEKQKIFCEYLGTVMLFDNRGERTSLHKQ